MLQATSIWKSADCAEQTADLQNARQTWDFQIAQSSIRVWRFPDCSAQSSDGADAHIVRHVM